MLRFVNRMIHLAGSYSGKLKFSFAISFLENLLQNVPVFLLLFTFDLILNENLSQKYAWIIGSIILAVVLIRMFLRYWFIRFESGTGYEICSRERLELGKRLRHFPMSFYSEGNLGNVSSVVTIDLPFIEEKGMDALDKIVSYYAFSVIGIIFLCTISLPIGLIALITYLIAGLSFKWLEVRNKKQSFIRQQQQASLVGAVLEYIRGISVIKAFNITGERAVKLTDAIDSTCKNAIQYEAQSMIPTIVYKTCFCLGSFGITLFSSFMAYKGELEVASAIMAIVFTFSMFVPAQMFASISSQLRVMEAGLNRYENLRSTEPIKDGMKPFPEKENIQFEDVSFSYKDSTVIENISFLSKPKTITALVGPSGGGKTTIANLIARFWDVDSGTISIDGIDVRDIKYDDLLQNISFVFQDVYLFNDTIRNNISFGTPGASYESIIEAAKKAKCHDFIMSLPNGYDTVLQESGGGLSGGERQRISIARAILKNAPIVIFDEATASIDPDNESDIQLAIDSLIKDRTLIMIAHRLTTIQNADNILVIDDKHIIESGRHEELINLNGKYYDLWSRRQKASGWKI